MRSGWHLCKVFATVVNLVYSTCLNLNFFANDYGGSHNVGAKRISKKSTIKNN